MNRLPGTCGLLFVVFASLFLLAACGGGGDSGSSTSSTTSGNTTSTTLGDTPVESVVVSPEASCNIAGFARAMLDALNQARATGRNCGTAYYPAVAPLAWNTLLAQAAAGHSIDMATNNYFSHTSLDGRSAKDRIDATGYLGSYWGENIAGGPADVDAVMSGWLASPGHCANMMNSAYKDFGAACAYNAAAYGKYWTQDFAAPR